MLFFMGHIEMATIGRKTVPFENLEKPISDYFGGTGTMANFFKMLSKCKQDIIEQTGTDFCYRGKTPCS